MRGIENMPLIEALRIWGELAICMDRWSDSQKGVTVEVYGYRLGPHSPAIALCKKEELNFSDSANYIKADLIDRLTALKDLCRMFAETYDIEVQINGTPYYLFSDFRATLHRLELTVVDSENPAVAAVRAECEGQG